MTLTPQDLSYIAGFFDGEGSISMHLNCRPSPRGLSPNHTLQVSIGNTDIRVLEWIQKEYGGNISYRKAASHRHKPVFQWFLRAAQTLRFLEEVSPYLKMKSEQAAIALEFQRSKKMGGSKQVSPETIAWRESVRNQIRILNGRNLTDEERAAR